MPQPQWIKVVFAHASGPVPPHDVIRSALTVPIVVGVAYALAGAQPALFAAIAALLVVLSERAGTTGQRAFKSGAGLVAGVLAMTLKNSGRAASPPKWRPRAARSRR